MATSVTPVTFTTFDQLLRLCGQFGRYQQLQYVLCAYVSMLTGTQALANVFLLGQPNFRCLNSSDSAVGARLDVDPFAKTCARRADCPAIGYDASPYGGNLFVQWNLGCGLEYLPAIAQSLFMLGFLVGALLFGVLSDVIGRYRSCMLAVAVLTVTSICASFVTMDFWLHSAIRTVGGVASAGCITVAFVLTMENVGPDRRMVPAVVFQAGFAVGYILYAAANLFVKDAFGQQILLSAIAVSGLFCFIFLNESPRWLFARGHFRRANRVVRKMVQRNRIGDFGSLECMLDDLAVGSAGKNCELHKRGFSLFDLLRTRNMRNRTLNLFFVWFVNGSVFYGLSMGAADLAGGPCLNVALSGLFELVGLALCVFAVLSLGRRVPLAALLAAAGLAVLATTFLSGLAVTSLQMAGKTFIGGSFALIYVYTAELTPTVVRNLGVGSGSMFARVGSLLAPQVALLGKTVWTPLPLLFFGMTAVLAGVFSLALPETRARLLPESLLDGENFGKKRVVGTPAALDMQAAAVQPTA